MTLSRAEHDRLEARTRQLKAEGVAFATATVVRTVNATSARPGSKVLIDASGTILVGWVGGNCARNAVSKAAREAIASGSPQFISLHPQQLLETEGLHAGDVRDGVKFARNGCPSEGSMDIFIEPVLPLPRLAIFGGGVVAMALADLAARFDFDVVMIDPSAPGATDDFSVPTSAYVVVATQGQNDRAALEAAALSGAAHASFVGSRKKFKAIAARVIAQAPDTACAIERVKAPAGLHINAITPEEIALSILAEITQHRRSHSGLRHAHDASSLSLGS